MLPSGTVVVFKHVDSLFAGEPLIEVAGPLARAFRVRRGDQSERGDVVGILLALADEDRDVGRGGDQLRQLIRNFWAGWFARYPAVVVPMKLRELLGRGARDLQIRCGGGVMVYVFRETATPLAFSGRIAIAGITRRRLTFRRSLGFFAVRIIARTRLIFFAVPRRGFLCGGDL